MQDWCAQGGPHSLPAFHAAPPPLPTGSSEEPSWLGHGLPGGQVGASPLPQPGEEAARSLVGGNCGACPLANLKQSIQAPRSLTSVASTWDPRQRDYSPLLPHTPPPAQVPVQTGGGWVCAHTHARVLCLMCWGAGTLGELAWGWGVAGGAEQVSTEPARPARVELGGAGRSRSRFPRGEGVRVCLWIWGVPSVPQSRMQGRSGRRCTGLALAAPAPFRWACELRCSGREPPVAPLLLAGGPVSSCSRTPEWPGHGHALAAQPC